MNEQNHPNPFIDDHKRREEDRRRFGIDDLSPAAQFRITMMASDRIWKEHITSEEEKIKVYQETKQHYLEYQKYKNDSQENSNMNQREKQHTFYVDIHRNWTRDAPSDWSHKIVIAKDGKIGMQCGDTMIVKTIEHWIAIARESERPHD